MKISLAWLENYVNLGKYKKDPQSLAHDLTMRGLEVSGVTSTKPEWTHVVVGKINKIEKHPNADKLSLCEVTDGKKTYQVVCGAKNISEGDCAPFAKIGAKLPGDFEIKQAKLRGVDSFGMLCSQKELGMGENTEGIFILPPDATPGMPLEDALAITSDTVLEVEVTANRGDCLSHLGVAREVAALTKGKVQKPQSKIKFTQPAIHKVASVTVKHPQCSRYAAMIVEGVEVKPSPACMQAYLRSVGLRPINNVVDVTNFILMAYGQPLHAFDFDKLLGKKIIVRKPLTGEKIKTLDEEIRELEPQDIVIADAEKAIALGGVMGGFDSQVTTTTKNILIESACFDPVSIRKTSKRLKLQSESSYRFERGVDIEGVVFALERAATLMSELGGGKVLRGHIDVYPVKRKKRDILLSQLFVNTFIGKEVPGKTIKIILESFGFSVKTQKKDSWKVGIPSFRLDVSNAADLVEEIVRSIGFDSLPLVSLPAPRDFQLKDIVEFKIKNLLAAQGFHEAVNYSFVSEELLSSCGIQDKTHKLLNPINEDFAHLRPVLFPSLLKTLAYNVHRNNKSIKLFEIRRVFCMDVAQDLPHEEEHLALLLSGSKTLSPWPENQKNYDFYDAKGAIETVLESLGFAKSQIEFKDGKRNYFHPSISAEILVHGEPAGYLGELHPEIQKKFDIEQNAYIAELFFSKLVQLAGTKQSFKAISKFPSVTRDVAIVVDESITHQHVTKCLDEVKFELVQDYDLFDIYRDDQQIGRGKKSLAYRVIYQSYEKTLTDEEIQATHNKIVKLLEAKLGAHVRS